MKAKEAFGSAIGFAVVIGSMLVSATVFAFFVKGGIWLSERALPWASGISGVTFCIVVFLLLPLAIPRRTRGFSSTSIFALSYVFGITAFMFSLVATYKLWGGLGVIVGLLLGGIGIVPVALVASLFKGAWPIFFFLVLLLVATYGSRVGALTLAESVGEQANNLSEPKPLSGAD